jgi:hypothetical protein
VAKDRFVDLESPFLNDEVLLGPPPTEPESIEQELERYAAVLEAEALRDFDEAIAEGEEAEQELYESKEFDQAEVDWSAPEINESPAGTGGHIYEDFEGIEEVEEAVEEQQSVGEAYEDDTEHLREWGEAETAEESTAGEVDTEEEKPSRQQTATVNVLLDEPIESDDKYELVSKDGKYAKTLGAADAAGLVAGAKVLTFRKVNPKNAYKLIHIRSTGSRRLVLPVNPFDALTTKGHGPREAKNTYVTVASQVPTKLTDRYGAARPVDPILVAPSPVLVDLTVDDPRL